MGGGEVEVEFSDLDVTTQRANSEMVVSGSERIESKLQVRRRIVFLFDSNLREKKTCSFGVCTERMSFGW